MAVCPEVLQNKQVFDQQIFLSLSVILFCPLVFLITCKCGYSGYLNMSRSTCQKSSVLFLGAGNQIVFGEIKDIRDEVSKLYMERDGSNLSLTPWPRGVGHQELLWLGNRNGHCSPHTDQNCSVSLGSPSDHLLAGNAPQTIDQPRWKPTSLKSLQMLWHTRLLEGLS